MAAVNLRSHIILRCDHNHPLFEQGVTALKAHQPVL